MNSFPFKINLSSWNSSAGTEFPSTSIETNFQLASNCLNSSCTAFFFSAPMVFDRFQVTSNRLGIVGCGEFVRPVSFRAQAAADRQVVAVDLVDALDRLPFQETACISEIDCLRILGGVDLEGRRLDRCTELGSIQIVFDDQLAALGLLCRGFLAVDEE